ncbi:unnamed protein product [Dimorphilus gyrociliatus]|uniref:RING-type domain-containing protein n=1 Tax=Dimorphilus gyrociliatus TaxID=2664684 RepID=A0A7I8VEI4_9ANNE|nr:unnamed protein product [Dimorphilus gyrociliatus]
MSCPVCFGTLSKSDCRLLPCHESHIFCDSCLEKLPKRGLINKEFDCPLCKRILKIPRNGIKGFEKYSSPKASEAKKKLLIQKVKDLKQEDRRRAECAIKDLKEFEKLCSEKKNTILNSLEVKCLKKKGELEDILKRINLIESESGDLAVAQNLKKLSDLRMECIKICKNNFHIIGLERLREFKLHISLVPKTSINFERVCWFDSYSFRKLYFDKLGYSLMNGMKTENRKLCGKFRKALSFERQENFVVDGVDNSREFHELIAIKITIDVTAYYLFYWKVDKILRLYLPAKNELTNMDGIVFFNIDNDVYLTNERGEICWRRNYFLPIDSSFITRHWKNTLYVYRYTNCSDDDETIDLSYSSINEINKNATYSGIPITIEFVNDTSASLKSIFDDIVNGCLFMSTRDFVFTINSIEKTAKAYKQKSLFQTYIVTEYHQSEDGFSFYLINVLRNEQKLKEYRMT